MDKRYDDLAEAMGEVAAARDERLRDNGAVVSPHRLERLHVALAAAFPLETALQRVADIRDASLEAPAMLPASLERVFQHHVSGKQPAPAQRAALLQRCAASVQTFFASILTPTQFAAAVACILVGIGALHFGRMAGNDGARISQPGPHPHSATRIRGEPAYQNRLDNGFLRKSTHELTLRVSTIEIASLQPSLLTINRALLADGHGLDRGLPLDLPIRQIFIDADAAATP